MPFLVVAPLSTLPHWKAEIEGCTNLKAQVYHGNARDRELIEDLEFFRHSGRGVAAEGWKERKLATMRFKFDVLVTTMTMLRKSPRLSRVKWACMVFDEAHRCAGVERGCGGWAPSECTAASLGPEPRHD